MTEAEWLECDDPDQMLLFLLESKKASSRKARLLLCAVARAASGGVPDGRSLDAVDDAEGFADGAIVWAALSGTGAHAQAASAELAAAFLASLRAARGKYRRNVKEAAARADQAAVAARAASLHPLGFLDTNTVSDDPFYYDERLAINALLRRHEGLIHEVFGDPFATPLIDPGRVGIAGGMVQTLAAAAYDNRDPPSGHLDPARLAVLSDALEEAGCPDADLLSHLRSSGPHVRGCWALDLILGKA